MLPADLAHGVIVELHEIQTPLRILGKRTEQRGPGTDVAGRFDQAQNALHQRGLAASRFPGKTEDLVAMHLNVHAIHHLV